MSENLQMLATEFSAFFRGEKFPIERAQALKERIAHLIQKKEMHGTFMSEGTIHRIFNGIANRAVAQAELTMELEKLQEQVQSLSNDRADVERLEKKMKDLEEQLDQNKCLPLQQLETLQQALTVAEDRAVLAEANSEYFQHKLDEANELVHTLEMEIKGLDQNLSRSQTDLQELQTQLDEVLDCYDAAQKEIGRLLEELTVSQHPVTGDEEEKTNPFIDDSALEDTDDSLSFDDHEESHEEVDLAESVEDSVYYLGEKLMLDPDTVMILFTDGDEYWVALEDDIEHEWINTMLLFVFTDRSSGATVTLPSSSVKQTKFPAKDVEKVLYLNGIDLIPEEVEWMKN